MLFPSLESGGRAVGENKAITSKKARYEVTCYDVVGQLGQWLHWLQSSLVHVTGPLWKQKGVYFPHGT